jgi:hypothetical protein
VIPDAREALMVQAAMAQAETAQAEMVNEFSMEAPALRWEPCVEASAIDDHGMCAGCGWPADDHDGAFEPARGAVVIRVPERLPLRRAS